jgi:hypothetical protein
MLLTMGFVLLLGISTFAVAAQEPNGDGKESGEENDPQGTPEGTSEGPQGYTEMFGKFELDENSLSGRYVSFDLIEGKISDYSYVPEEENIFSSVGFTVDPFGEENTRMEGGVYHAEVDGLHFMSHNNPTAMMHATYSGEEWVNMTFEPAVGITFGAQVDGCIPVLGLSAEAEITPGTEDYEIKEGVLEINITKGVITSFMRIPYQTMSSFQEEVVRGVQEGKIDSELQVMKKEGSTTESQQFPYQGKVQMQLKDSEEGKELKFQVQSEEKSGKVLMFKVQGDLLNDVEAGKVRINFDGEKAVKTGAPEEVLNENGEQCKYYLEKDVDGCYNAMVYVPGFSTHEISMEIEEDTSDSPFLYAGALLILLGTVSLLLAVTRRSIRS